VNVKGDDMILFKCDFCGAGPVEALGSNSYPDGWKDIRVNVNYTGQVALHSCPVCTVKYGFKDRLVPRETIVDALSGMIQGMIEDNQG